MVTLDKWFQVNIARPMFAATLAFILALLGLAGAIYFQESRRMEYFAKNATTSINQALNQRNLPNIEAALSRAMQSMNAEFVVLCRQSQIEVGLGALGKSCPTVGQSWIMIYEYDLAGFSDYRLIISRMPTFLNTYILVLLLSVIGIIIGISLLIHRIQSAVINSMLKPLRNGLLFEQKLGIFELEQIRLEFRTIEELRSHENETGIRLNAVKQIVHDIKSPLSVLRLILQRGKINTETISLLKNAADKISAITDDFSDCGSSTRTAYIMAIDEIFFQLEALKKAEINNRPIRLHFDVDSAFSKSIQKLPISNMQLFRMCSNLLNNSIEAIEKVGKISCKVFKSGNALKVVITNDGKPIPSEIIAAMGQYRISSGKVDALGNRGMGLKFAFDLVAAAQGQIQLRNVSGEGAVVELSIPILANPAKEQRTSLDAGVG